MGLINLRTNLKDLKFGNDESGGGSSKQPFIQTRIPATDEPLQTNISANASLNVSVNNLGQSLPNILGSAAIGAGGGALFGGGVGAIVGAGVGLGLGIAGAIETNDFSVGVKADASLKFPVAGTGGPDFLLRGGLLLPNIIANDAARLTKYFASTEGVLFSVKQNLLSRLAVKTQASPILLNEGIYTPISTLSQVVGNAFGLHVNKQGLNPFGGFLGLTTYSDVIKDKILPEETNRLIQLTNDKISSGLDDVNILSYGGGPNSFLGIGKTNISFATGNTGAPLKVSNATTDTTLDYKELDQISNDTSFGKSINYINIIDFRQSLKNIVSKAPSYDPGKNKTLETRTNLGDPGNSSISGKKPVSYTNGYSNVDVSFGAATANSYDKINALPIYRSTNESFVAPNLNPNTYSDLVNFRIGVIDNDVSDTNLAKIDYIHFRAFLNTINDSYDATWNPVKYIGRGENFYTYSGFDRKVSLSWTVAAQSKAELIPMYKKLNYLASLCAPDYSSFGYMRGNIVKLTIGGYFYEQPGIITSISYEMNDENTSWEVGIDDNGDIDNSVKQLPHIIKVNNFNFIPIHQFVPRKQQNKFRGIDGEDTGFISSYGDERFIALQGADKDGVTNTAYNSALDIAQDKALSKFNGLINSSPPSDNAVEPTLTLEEQLGIEPLPGTFASDTNR
jgi:hypothetical protein